MNLWLVLLGLIIAAAVAAAIFGLRGFLREVPLDERNYQDPLPGGLQLIWPVVTLVTRFIAPRMKSAQLEKTHRALQAAGQDYVLTPEEFAALRIVAGAIVAGVFVLVAAMLGKSGAATLALCIVAGAALGWLYPVLWLAERRKLRERIVVRDLPVFLDFITMAVEAGLNITGAIEQSVLKGPPGPLAQEFNRMLRDLRAGLPRSEALKRLAERMDIAQIASFTSTLIQADRVGASLGETLRAQSMQRREERFLRAEKLALEAPVKMMLPLVMFFFPLIFLVLGYFIYLQMQQQGLM